MGVLILLYREGSVNMQESINHKDIEGFGNSFDSKAEHIVAMNAVVANGINQSAVNVYRPREVRHTFSVSLPNVGDITNQKQSGRCWMFAALNVMRIETMEKLNLKTFELSQNYPLFWDKLEKSNWFLESIIETKDEPVDGRLVSFLLESPMGDGGQWDMFVNLVEKYGLVPKEAMPESIASSATRELDKYLTTKLREFACILRTAAKKNGKTEGELREIKGDMLQTVYRMLCIALGKPPVSFTFEVRDKDDKFIRAEHITPVEFYKRYVGMNLDDYVSLINAPTDDKPYGKTYTVQYLGNVKGGRDIRYLNLPPSDLKDLAIKQLRDGKAVWFGSDVGQFSDKKSGMMDLEALDVKDLFDTNFPLSKAQRLDYGESRMTHAMVLTGVNIDGEGKPDRWRVENSWGDEPGQKGFFVMTDRWFDEYTYQVVVNKKYLTEEQKTMLSEKPVVLKPWDPMGSLAC